jgi:hypothetical protein
MELSAAIKYYNRFPIKMMGIDAVSRKNRMCELAGRCTWYLENEKSNS